MPEIYRIPVVLETKGFSDASRQSKDLSSSLSGLSDKAKNLGSTLKNISQIALGGLGIKELAHTVSTFNKDFYDLSRQGKLAGISLQQIKIGVEGLASSTKLSRQEAANFYKQVNQMTAGAKMGAEEIKRMGKVLSDEFGSSVEDVTQSLEKLMQVQNKNVQVFKRLQEGMDPGRASTLTLALEDFYGISSDASDAAMRFTTSIASQGKNLDANEKKLRSMSDTLKEANKTASDTKLNFAEKSQESLQKTYEVMTSVQKLLQEMPATIIQAGVAFGALSGVPALFGQILSAAKGLRGSLGGGSGGGGGGGGGILSGIGSLLGGGKGSGGVLKGGVKAGGGGIVSNATGFLGGLIGMGKGNAQGDMCGTCAGSMGDAVQGAVETGMEKVTGRTVERLAEKGGKSLATQATKVLGPRLAGIGGKLAVGAGKIVGGGGIGALVSLAGQAIGTAIEKSGHEKIGAGVRAGTNVAGWAMGGAAIGSALLPGIGTAIGGIAGAVYGAIDSFEDIKKATGDWASKFVMSSKDVEDAQKVLATTYGESAAELPGTWDKVKNFFLNFAGEGETALQMMERKQMQFMSLRSKKERGGEGTTYEEMSESKQKAFRDTAAEIHKMSGIGAREGDAKSQLDAATMVEVMRGSLQEAGRDSTTEDAIKAVSEFTSGKLATDIGNVFSKQLGDKGKVGAAKEVAISKFGASAAGDISGATKADEERLRKADLTTKAFEAQRQVIRQMNVDMQQQNEVLERNSKALSQQSEYYAKFLGMNDDSVKSAREAMKNKEAEIANIEKYIGLQGEARAKLAEQEKAELAVLQQAKEAGKTVIDMDGKQVQVDEGIAEKKANINLLTATQNELITKRNDIELALINMGANIGKSKEEELGLMREQLSVLDSQQEVLKATYAGAGPSLAIMQQQYTMHQNMKKTASEQLKLVQEEIASSKKRTNKESIELITKEARLRKQILESTKAQAEMTKEVAEGYLDAMMASSNAEGTFSKIILGQQAGIGLLQREQGAAQGQRMGMVGGGATSPMMRIERRVGITYDQQKMEEVRNQYMSRRPMQPETLAGQRPFMGGQASWEATLPGAQDIGLAAANAASRDAGMPGRVNESPEAKEARQQANELAKKIAPFQEMQRQGLETPTLTEEVKKGQQEIQKLMGEAQAVQGIDDMAAAVEKGMISAMGKTGMTSLADDINKGQAGAASSGGIPKVGGDGAQGPKGPKGLKFGQSVIWGADGTTQVVDTSDRAPKLPPPLPGLEVGVAPKEASENDSHKFFNWIKGKLYAGENDTSAPQADARQKIEEEKNVREDFITRYQEQQTKEDPELANQLERVKHPVMGQTMSYRMDLGDISDERGIQENQGGAIGPNNADRIVEELNYQRGYAEETKGNTETTAEATTRTANAVERMANAAEGKSGAQPYSLGPTGGDPGGQTIGFDYIEKIMQGRKFSGGGMVYGRTGGDKVPAMLEHGEMVMSRSSVANNPWVKGLATGGEAEETPYEKEMREIHERLYGKGGYKSEAGQAIQAETYRKAIEDANKTKAGQAIQAETRKKAIEDANKTRSKARGFVPPARVAQGAMSPGEEEIRQKARSMGLSGTGRISTIKQHIRQIEAARQEKALGPERAPGAAPKDSGAMELEEMAQKSAGKVSFKWYGSRKNEEGEDVYSGESYGQSRPTEEAALKKAQEAKDKRVFTMAQAKFQMGEEEEKRAQIEAAGMKKFAQRSPTMSGSTKEGKQWKIKTGADMAQEDSAKYGLRGGDGTSDFLSRNEAEIRRLSAGSTGHDQGNFKTELEIARSKTQEKRDREFNERMDSIGARDEMNTKAIERARQTERKALLLAGGNMVPGSGTGDTVPAMLTPGEFVVNARQSKNNMSVLRRINSGENVGQRFGFGGMVLENVFSPVIPSPVGARHMAAGGVAASFSNTFNVGGGGSFKQMMGEIQGYLSKQWEYPYGGTGRRVII